MSNNTKSVTDNKETSDKTETITAQNKKNIKSINYYKQFSNTENLPNTEIIKNIENNYPEYLEIDRDVKVNLNELFDFNFEDLFENTSSKNSVSIDKKNIQNNQSFTLEKLISYLIYTKSNDFLVKEDSDSYKLDIKDLKNQVGKDVGRIKIYINNILFNYHNGGDPESSTPKTVSKQKQKTQTPLKEKTESIEKIKTPTPEKEITPKTQTQDNPIRNLISGNEKYVGSPPVIIDDSTNVNLDNNNDNENDNNVNEKKLSNFEIVDKYNEQIIRSFDSKKINYDILNQIDILSCQNIFNLISELLQLMLNTNLKDKLHGEYIMVSPTTKKDTNDTPTKSNEKTIHLTINSETNLMKIYFDTYLFSSSDFISIGRMTFTVSLNFLTNTFLMDTLYIKCNPDNITSKKSSIDNDTDMDNDSDNNQTKTNVNYFNKIKDATGNYISSHPNLSKIAIPAGVAGVGLATLFGLGVLGGKTKKIRKTRRTKRTRKTRKTRKTKKTKKFTKTRKQKKIKKNKSKITKQKSKITKTRKL